MSESHSVTRWLLTPGAANMIATLLDDEQYKGPGSLSQQIERTTKELREYIAWRDTEEGCAELVTQYQCVTSLKSVFEALGVKTVEEALDRIAWLNEEVARQDT